MNANASAAGGPPSARPGLWPTLKNIWAFALPYFQSEEKWRARGLLLAVVLLNLGTVYMLVQINEWYRVFYDALQEKQQDVFWQQIARFGWLALIFIVLAVYKFYLTQILQLRWRVWLTDHYMGRWLANKAFYRMELARYTSDRTGNPDNPDQRIQEDLNLFTSYTVSLSMGMFNALITLVSFIGILWTLSGSLTVPLPGGGSWEIAGYMVWAAVLYCAVGSAIAHWIGKPQVRLNFQQQMLEANFRHHMVRVREYSESIALDGGERVERHHLDLRFRDVMHNYFSLIRNQKQLTWFSSFFAQAAIIFPMIVAAPRYFSGAIQLGQLMQINSAFGRVQDSLSWLVDNYMALAVWKATTDRLVGFEASLQHQSTSGDGYSVTTSPSGAQGIRSDHLAIDLPDGQALLADVNLHVQPGDTVLLQGPSGSGKSSLFRALSGIWPHARGRVELPQDTMFIPQRPYFPDGSLRNALAYPEPADRYTDDALREALTDALLPALTDQLDREDAWNQKLSGGERQRLAIARVLLKRPAWVLADEATSALDEDAEATVYQRLVDRVKQMGGALVSIAHRSTLAAHHRQRWALKPGDAAPGQPGAPDAARYRIEIGNAG